MVLGQSLSEFLIGFGVICGAVTVIITTVVLVARLPPIRWLFRHLFSGPMADYWTKIIKDGAREFHEESVAPQIDAIELKVDELVSQGETSWHKDKSWIVSRVTLLEARYNYVRERQETFRAEMAAVLTGEQDLDEVRKRALAALESPAPVEPGVVVD